MILDKRVEARGESDISIGVPSPFVRGFCIARAGLRLEAVAKVR